MLAQCSSVGFEVWPLFVGTSIGLYFFVFATRSFQDWLRMRRVTGRGFRMVPDAVFGRWGVWLLRGLGVIPALLWIGSVSGVYCFFHGPG
jgi:hypothetical protein